jgi:hypothetical protein
MSLGFEPVTTLGQATSLRGLPGERVVNKLRQIIQRCRMAVCAALASLVMTGAALATTVEATFTQLSGNLWSVTFVVRNDGSIAVIDSLTIYFPVDFASGLSLLGAPARWDVLLVQPDRGLASNGFIDLLSPGQGQGLTSGQSFEQLSAQFTWNGTSVPTTLTWTVNDANSYAVLERGLTVPAQVGTDGQAVAVTPVPEPSTYALFLVGALAIAAVSGRRKHYAGNRPAISAAQCQ